MRKFVQAMMNRIDANLVKRNGELLPGGDIRILGNQWLRASFEKSGLLRVPRETALRLSIQQLVKKKHLRSWLSGGCTMFCDPEILMIRIIFLMLCT